ncbi:MAG: hypothetical protein J0H91_08595 [Rhodospirillales bacterium]|nr:hypothetical protein [Rhodospirillales bacterium]
MAKGQMKSGREPKKPKATVKKPVVEVSSFSSLQPSKKPPAKSGSK